MWRVDRRTQMGERMSLTIASLCYFVKADMRLA